MNNVKSRPVKNLSQEVGCKGLRDYLISLQVVTLTSSSRVPRADRQDTLGNEWDAEESLGEAAVWRVGDGGSDVSPGLGLRQGISLH